MNLNKAQVYKLAIAMLTNVANNGGSKNIINKYNESIETHIKNGTMLVKGETIPATEDATNFYKSLNNVLGSLDQVTTEEEIKTAADMVAEEFNRLTNPPTLDMDMSGGEETQEETTEEEPVQEADLPAETKVVKMTPEGVEKETPEEAEGDEGEEEVEVEGEELIDFDYKATNAQKALWALEIVDEFRKELSESEYNSLMDTIDILYPTGDIVDSIRADVKKAQITNKNKNAVYSILNRYKNSNNNTVTLSRRQVDVLMKLLVLACTEVVEQ